MFVSGHSSLTSSARVTARSSCTLFASLGGGRGWTGAEMAIKIFVRLLAALAYPIELSYSLPLPVKLCR